MNEQEREQERKIRKFCDDFAFEYVTGLSIEPELENVTGKSMRKMHEGLKSALSISIKNLLDEL